MMKMIGQMNGQKKKMNNLISRNIHGLQVQKGLLLMNVCAVSLFVVFEEHSSRFQEKEETGGTVNREGMLTVGS